jgi:hypothetical protein
MIAPMRLRIWSTSCSCAMSGSVENVLEKPYCWSSRSSLTKIKCDPLVTMPNKRFCGSGAAIM